MATAQLPGSLHAKLTDLARRMTLLRVTRAAAGTLLVLAVVAGLALAVDYAFRLPSVVRFLVLAGWIVLAVAGVVRCGRGLGRRADADALAALIESEYPNLAERLTTSVELTEAGSAGHGSPALIELLLRETEIRAGRLDFLRAAPERPTYRRAGHAVLAVALLAAPAAFWPHSYGNRLKRLVMPWAKVAPPYEVVTRGGDLAVARGQSLTLAAHVRATGPVDELPAAATLVITDPAGQTSRLAMKSEQPQVFHYKLNAVAEGFRYRVEAGEAVGGEHEVVAVDPVQLVADSPAITVTPPAYAQKSVETKSITGMGDFSALQHGQLAYRFQFTRPAAAARVEWAPVADGERAKPVRRELTPGDGGTTAQLELPVERTGRLTLTLEAERGIVTELPPQLVNVLVDHPPAFVKAAGVTEQLRSVSAYETVPLDLSVADDYGVELIEIEYRVNDGPAKTEKVTIDGLGTAQAAGRFGLKLLGKVKEDDTFQFRLKAADNRRVPEARLGPNVVYLPADNRWYSFKIARHAEPLKQQEIAAQRDHVRERLDALIERLRGEEQSIYSRHQEAKRGLTMTPDDVAKLQDVRAEHQANERTLTELARDAGQTPELRPLANRMQDVADQQMRNAAAGLQQAERERTKAPQRAEGLSRARKEVDEAIRRLEDLKKLNEDLARQRLDQMRLEQLADREQQLAEQAKKEADPQKAAELAREQQRLAEELRKLTEESDPLKKALEAAQSERAKELADKARELARQQRDLAQAMRQTNREAMKGALDELAKKQKELAKQAELLAQQTRQPTAAAQARPLDPEKPRDAANALEKGDANAALTRQEETAQDLDRLASALDKAIELGRDPKEAAKQLARLQDELKHRTTNEARRTPLDRMEKGRLDDLRKEQQAIKQAAERLSVPEVDTLAKRDRAEAAEHARKAAEELARKDQAKAEANMELAKKALERLGDRLPNLPQRLAAARGEVAELRKKQDDIARQAEQLAKQAEAKPADADKARRDLAQKLADAARKQADALDRLARLDVPSLEQRQERAQESMYKALQDLLSARRQDIPASQNDARRQLERLEQALNGQKPVDEKAAELARRQQQLAEQAAKLAKNDQPDPARDQAVQKLRAEQQKVAQETAKLPPTEAPQRQAEAAKATRQADKAAQQGDQDMAQKSADAAKALQQLADQLNGAEDDARKAERLAKKQAELAQQAEQLAKKPDQAAKDELRKKQKQLQEEAQQLRGGDQAAREKQKADELVARLTRTEPEKSAETARQAAEALHRLADRLGGKSEAQKASELARDQKRLADDAAKPQPMNGDDKTQAEQAAQRQGELARRLQGIDPGDNGELAKQVAERMQKAQKALEQAQNPQQATEPLRKAADSAEQLAQALRRREQTEQARDKPQSLEELARRQQQLNQESEQARKAAASQSPQQSQEGMQRLAREQARLSEQVGRLPPSAQPKVAEHARQAMNRAEQALARGNWEGAQQNQRAAARALQDLARQQQANNRPSAGQPQQPSNLPDRAQSEQARQLAQQQRELRDAVQRALSQQAGQGQRQGNNPAGELAREQRAIADAAEQMARQQAQHNGQQAPQSQQSQQAARAARQASNQVESGALPQARQSGQQAAQQLQQLAQNGQGEPARQARQLAQRQESVNRQLEQMAGNARAQQAQQQARQEQLRQQADDLARQMLQQADQMRGAPGQPAMRQAAQAGRQAEGAMQQAQRGQQQGNASGTQQSQQQAARDLDRAAQFAQQSAQSAQQAEGQPQRQTGQALQQAQNQMGNAQRQLGQGRQQQAQGSMQNAAQSLQQAAQSLAQQGQPGAPPQGPSATGENDGSAAGAVIDLAKYGKDAARFQGRAWGELPGELRTRIIQDMKAQYGDDYGRMIKLYFEQLADKKVAPR